MAGQIPKAVASGNTAYAPPVGVKREVWLEHVTRGHDTSLTTVARLHASLHKIEQEAFALHNVPLGQAAPNAFPPITTTAPAAAATTTTTVPANPAVGDGEETKEDGSEQAGGGDEVGGDEEGESDEGEGGERESGEEGGDGRESDDEEDTEAAVANRHMACVQVQT